MKTLSNKFILQIPTETPATRIAYWRCRLCWCAWRDTAQGIASSKASQSHAREYMGTFLHTYFFLFLKKEISSKFVDFFFHTFQTKNIPKKPRIFSPNHFIILESSKTQTKNMLRGLHPFIPHFFERALSLDPWKLDCSFNTWWFSRRTGYFSFNIDRFELSSRYLSWKLF